MTIRPLLRCLPLILVALGATLARAEDGYRLWLRYDLVADTSLRESYTQALGQIVIGGDAYEIRRVAIAHDWNVSQRVLVTKVE